MQPPSQSNFHDRATNSWPSQPCTKHSTTEPHGSQKHLNLTFRLVQVCVRYQLPTNLFPVQHFLSSIHYLCRMDNWKTMTSLQHLNTSSLQVLLLFLCVTVYISREWKQQHWNSVAPHVSCSKCKWTATKKFLSGNGFGITTKSIITTTDTYSYWNTSWLPIPPGIIWLQWDFLVSGVMCEKDYGVQLQMRWRWQQERA